MSLKETKEGFANSVNTHKQACFDCEYRAENEENRAFYKCTYPLPLLPKTFLFSEFRNIGRGGIDGTFTEDAVVEECPTYSKANQ